MNFCYEPMSAVGFLADSYRESCQEEYFLNTRMLTVIICMSYRVHVHLLSCDVVAMENLTSYKLL